MTGTLTHSEHPTARLLVRDIQDETPEHRIALSYVGVTGTQRMVHLTTGGTAHQTMLARIDAGASLSAGRRGAHMSRFHEAIDAACLGVPAHPLLVAARMAAGIAERQDSGHACTTFSGDLLLDDTSPVSVRRCHVPALIEVGAASCNGTWRGIISVSVAGMNACPCAQELVRDSSMDRLLKAGYDETEAQRILALVPGATHNQRGTATLTLGYTWNGAWEDAPAALAIADQVSLARASMGTEIHELLKRGDEHAVVLASHERPRFVEDCTRELISLCAADTRLADETHAWARQINHESIHAHDVETSAHALLGDLRAERGTSRNPDPRSWMRAVE